MPGQSLSYASENLLTCNKWPCKYLLTNTRVFFLCELGPAGLYFLDLRCSSLCFLFASPGASSLWQLPFSENAFSLCQKPSTRRPSCDRNWLKSRIVNRCKLINFVGPLYVKLPGERGLSSTPETKKKMFRGYR